MSTTFNQSLNVTLIARDDDDRERPTQTTLFDEVESHPYKSSDVLFASVSPISEVKHFSMMLERACILSYTHTILPFCRYPRRQVLYPLPLHETEIDLGTP
jgi:hypothetical protein